MDIELSKIHTNPQNPRKVITNEDVDNMAASLNAVGLRNPIKLNVLPDGSYELMSGHIRFAGAQKLGWKTIPAEVLALSPEAALIEAVVDNQGKPMNWLEKAEAMKRLLDLPSKPKQQAVAEMLGTTQDDVSRKTALLRLLTPGARQAIYGNSINSPDRDIIPELVVRRIAELGDPKRIEEALNVAIDKKMTASQAKALVAQMQKSQHLGQFQPTPEPQDHQNGPKIKENTDSSDQRANALSESVQPSHEVRLVASPQADASTTSEAKVLPIHPVSSHSAPPTSPLTKSASPKTPSGTSTPRGSQQPSLFWEWVAGVSFIAQIRSKSKKGETLTSGEKALALGWRFLEGVGGLLKHLKLIPEMIKFVWKLLKDANRLIEDLFGKTVAKIVRIGLVLFIVWAIWFGPANNPLRQCKVLVSKAVSTVWSFVSPSGGLSASGSRSETSTQTAPVATNLSTSNSELQTPHSSAHLKPAHHSHPMIPYYPKPLPYNPSDLDKNYFNQQLAGIPKEALITPYSFQPDLNMGSDMAYHRLMDLQLKEKYTVLWGTDKETVTNIYSGASNMTLTMKNGLVGAFLGGSDKVNVYWEDIKTIYADVITTPASRTSHVNGGYEIFLVLTDSKKPLAIQCATGADLEHLVSALEFYIKLSGHNTAPIGSLPYLNQGVLFNDYREVTTLWADSPAGKTALTFHDILWSAERNMDKQQTKAQLETALQSLDTNGNHNGPLVQPNHGSRLVASTQVPGSHNLYLVKPDEWTNAKKASGPDNPDAFYPVRKKVTLNSNSQF